MKLHMFFPFSLMLMTGLSWINFVVRTAPHTASSTKNNFMVCTKCSTTCISKIRSAIIICTMLICFRVMYSKEILVYSLLFPLQYHPLQPFSQVHDPHPCHHQMEISWVYWYLQPKSAMGCVHLQAEVLF